MANTKSAERRMRVSARRHVQNKSIKQRLKTLESNYLDAVQSGNSESAGKLLRSMSSAYDKAAKVGVIHKAKANRKKSRLSAYLKPKATAEAAPASPA